MSIVIADLYIDIGENLTKVALLEKCSHFKTSLVTSHEIQMIALDV